MKPEFEVHVDVARSLVRTRLAGFFDDAAIGGYLTARKLACRRLQCGPNEHLSLIDVRDMAIQTQDIVTRWAAVLADPVYRSKRLAFVVGSTLVRTQLQRAIGGRDARRFTDAAKAEAWVLYGDAAAAA